MFEIRKDSFYLDGKPFRVFSGAMHYFRVLPEYWEDRLKKLKALGMNCVETVTCWNLHEPEEGKFDFGGMLNIVEFCKTAQKLGLYVIVRPGPYICAEWDFGGFPAWLLKDKNLRLRCNDAKYMKKAKPFLERMAKELKPMLISNGGNILAVQIENEYGSYGNDKEYLKAIEKILTDSGIDVPFFTSDGNTDFMLSGGTLPHIYKTLNFGSRANSAFNILEKYQKDMPKTCMEFWCGWFDHWGEKHHTRIARQVACEVKDLVDLGANINIYTFHGGTNFNFWAGANNYSNYQPTVTSYDDAALLNEYGDYTKAYHEVRKILHEAQGMDYGELPARPSLQNIGKVNLTKRADLWENIYVLGEKHSNVTPESMEYFNQNFGYILYETTIKGSYPSQVLYVEGVHDIAYLRVDGKLLKSYDRCKNKSQKNHDGFACRIPAFDKECKIQILVEGMGRTNYGPNMETDRKGIQKVRLGLQTIFGWDIYTLPFDNLDKVRFSDSADLQGGVILQGTFKAQQGKDCFVDMRGFEKGFVVVNGFNIGRYWKKGPQRTLYLPAPLLKENNTITVVENARAKDCLAIIDKHLL